MKLKRRNLYWKTSFCCQSDGGDDEGALMMLLWVSRPDEEDERLEREVMEIYSCSGETLEVLLLL